MFKTKMMMKSAVLGAILVANAIFAQVSTYTFSQSQGQYQELDNPTILATATGVYSGALDTNRIKVNLPFSFMFNGVSYDELYMYPKGFVSFGTFNKAYSDPISNAEPTFEGVISAFGADILSSFISNTKAATMSWKTVGTAPDREIVFQWKGFRFYNYPSNQNEDINFQIRLKENGIIQFVYDLKNIVNRTSAQNVQVGLRGATNADFNNRVAAGTDTNNWNSTLQGTANNGVVKTNGTTLLPASGLTFTYAPQQLSVAEVKANTNEDMVTIVPNPVSDVLYINTKETMKSIEIFDISGKKILSSEGKEILVSHLSKGNYILKITLKGEKIINKKFIKR